MIRKNIYSLILKVLLSVAIEDSTDSPSPKPHSLPQGEENHLSERRDKTEMGSTVRVNMLSVNCETHKHQLLTANPLTAIWL